MIINVYVHDRQYIEWTASSVVGYASLIKFLTSFHCPPTLGDQDLFEHEITLLTSTPLINP